MPDENGAESSAAGADSQRLPRSRLSSSTAAFPRPTSPSMRAEHDEEAIEEIKRYESVSVLRCAPDLQLAPQLTRLCALLDISSPQSTGLWMGHARGHG